MVTYQTCGRKTSRNLGQKGTVESLRHASSQHEYFEGRVSTWLSQMWQGKGAGESDGLRALPCLPRWISMRKWGGMRRLEKKGFDRETRCFGESWIIGTDFHIFVFILMIELSWVLWANLMSGPLTLFSPLIKWEGKVISPFFFILLIFLLYP